MFWQKFVSLCSKNNLSPNAVCAKLGYSGAIATKWKNGATPRDTTLKKISDFFNISVEYFKENNEETKISNIFPLDKKKIPLLGDIACGEPIYASEDRESYVMSGTDINADLCLRAKGDSMIGARILDGDIVFIKKTPTVNNGEIAAVIIGDEATLKRVYYYPKKGKLILQAENPKYEPLVYIGEELNEIRILGKAIAFQSDVI